MNIRKTWNLWRFLFLPGGFFILFIVVAEVFPDKIWGPIPFLLWVFVSFYIINKKCKCPRCKHSAMFYRFRPNPQLSWFTGYWPSNSSLRCIYCGQLIDDSDESPATVIIDGDVMHSRLVHKVDPICPEFVKSIGMSDVVVLDIITNEEGAVAEVVQAKGNPVFLEAAAIAVRQWRYSPTLIDGKPVSVESKVCIAFLSDGTVDTTQ